MKKLFTLLLICFSAITSHSQDFYHGGGVQIDMGFYNLAYTTPDVNYDGFEGASVPGVFYKATLGLADNFAISAYPFLGLNLNVNSQSGGSGSFGIQIPVNAELYLGEMDDGCFFIGGGFAYSFIADSYAGGGSIMGPQFDIGGQFNFKDNLVGLRGAYTLGVNSSSIEGATITKDSKFLISLGMYYLFGQ